MDFKGIYSRFLIYALGQSQNPESCNEGIRLYKGRHDSYYKNAKSIIL